jgi:glycosyltransferase involved in cell wall biosynthesis
MKIMHVITGLAQGGAEGTLLRLIENSPTPALHTVVSLMDEGVYGQRIKSLGVSLHCLNIKRSGIPLKGFFRLSKIINSNTPDLIQTWMYHADLLGGVAAWVHFVPVVWGVRRSELGRGQLGNGTWLIAKLCSALSWFIPRAIVNCSKRSIAAHRRFGYADKFVYLPNGFQTTQTLISGTERAALRQGWAFPHNAVIFGHVARLHHVKGQTTFVTAFAFACRSSNLIAAVMAGTGINKENEIFSSLIQGIPEEKLLAVGPSTEIPALMRSFDIFVLSSLSEGFPNVVAEAMLQGTPCIVTDVGDAAEIVGGTGWVVPPNDVGALANIMLHVASLTSEQRQQLGAAARQRIIENYSIEKMIYRFESVWQQAITGGAE